MKMLVLFILSLISLSSCIFSGAVDSERFYISAEDDIDYKRYIYVENSEGLIELVDLLDEEVTITDVAVSDIKYYLFTKTSANISYLITNGNASSLKDSDFDPDKLNLFITHGWRNNNESIFPVTLRIDALDNYDLNVFVVDWSSIAEKNYLTAQSNVKTVGDLVGEFINDIQSIYGINGSQFILVGHSLGAHVSGCAGAKMNSQANHITGLDPAGPLFLLSVTDNRLDTSDAKYVQVIHTNGLLLGMLSAIGDVDYYPNGGLVQPGCGVDPTGSCSHSRSYIYFDESIFLSQLFTSRKCSSFITYSAGLCNNNEESEMGQLFLNTTITGTFYLTTNSDYPYAKG